jgi:heme exporter protein D
MNWVKFFHMGGYAVFVWPSYGLSAVVLALNVILPLRERKRLLRGHNPGKHKSGRDSS